MPSSQKTFRVFVSSTFTDMRAERRVLQELVFPDLKRYCEARGAAFQAVDLRWGVNEESQREQKTMEICLTEIARCQRLSPRPNFIVLLGDRYGWQPVPNKIPAAENAELRPHFNAAEAKLIFDWYKEDTNAIPPEYVLQPRGDEYRDYDQWQPVEDNLRAALRKAVDQVGLSPEQRIKYFAAATHQEIINGALQPPVGGFDPADHVFAYLREMDLLPQGEKTGEYLDLLPDGTQDTYAKAQIKALKKELCSELPEDHIYKYSAQWGEGLQFDAKAFADRVYQDLVSVIDQELPEITAPDELTREKQLQADFAQRLIRFFVGQEEPRRRIAAYLKQGTGKPLAVIGPSGSGKSSLMAQALEDARQGFPGVIVYRFIGATSTSSNPLLMLRQICEEISGAYDTSLSALLKEGEDDKKLGSIYGLGEIFSRCLTLATENQPIFIFLDALDQLQDQRFDFLPHTLPDHAWLVVSALPELADRLSVTEVYRLPKLPEQDGEALLSAWLAEENRRLTEKQRQEVIGRFRENGLPLYLKLAFEQARQWHSYAEGKVLPAEVEGILAGYFDLLEKEHTPELVGKVAGYLLSGKYRGLTEAEVLDLLAFDREYWESFIKGSHPAHREEIEKLERLPFVVWSRLFLDLEPYLTERDADGLPIITFYHRKFQEYAGERYLKIPPCPPLGKGGLEEDANGSPLWQRGAGGDLEKEFHATLAGYFETRPLYLDDAEQAPNIRKVVEQPYQETLAAHWQALADTCLAHFPFLMAKAKAALVEGILEDYAFAFDKLPPEWREKLKFWEAFFREPVHILRRGNEDWPAYKILLQLAMEHANDSPETQGAERFLAAGKCHWPWLRRERRPEHAGLDPCLAVLEGHTLGVNGALVLPGGEILSWSDDMTLRLWDRDGKPLTVLRGHTSIVEGAMVLPDGQIISWGDSTLRFWDQSGQPLTILKGHTDSVKKALKLPDGRILFWGGKTLRLWEQTVKPLAVLKGHTDMVSGAMALSEGRILSWSHDKTLRLWGKSGEPLTVLEGHTGAVQEALALPDGRILSRASELSGDATLRLWDRDGQPLAILEGHTGWVLGALALSNWRILSWGDSTLRLWDQSGKPLTVLEGHTGWVNGAIVLPDEQILSWSADKTLRLWDQSGKPLAVFEGHTGWVNGAIVLPDGRILSWSDDKTLRLWEQTGRPLTVLEGHTERVYGALALPDGRILSKSEDMTLRVWDQSGKLLAVLAGHTHWIYGKLMLPEGRILSWSRDKTLRLWGQSGEPLTVLEGHTGGVMGALALPEGRILSWSRGIFPQSGDMTLRLWDRYGKPLAILEGHTDSVAGALVLPDERILSWSADKTLRLWDRAGKPLVVLEGHTNYVREALALPDGRILSWSNDRTLRLWDRAGKPLASLEGHTHYVLGAMALPDGRILSWSGEVSSDGSGDLPLRIWDRDGQPMAVLSGHTRGVWGALGLPDGRILSWSQDHTLRLWDRAGKTLNVLKSHTYHINGALSMPDGRILSWGDSTLRLWDRDGNPLTVLEGHTGSVYGALAMPDGAILSWSGDWTLRLWDNDGKPLAVYRRDEGLQLYSEAKRVIYGPRCVGNAYLTVGNNSAILAPPPRPAIVWHGASECTARLLYPDGRAVVTQANGQVCVLQLYHGNRPITLDELEATAASEPQL